MLAQVGEGVQFDTAYSNCSYYLIDASGGRGEPLDVAKARGAHEYLRKQGFFGQMGVAGWVSPGNVGEVIAAFSWWSVDAESGLRDEANELDLEKVRLMINLNIVLFVVIMAMLLLRIYRQRKQKARFGK
jgi:phosphoribosylanthranilate isomerase